MGFDMTSNGHRVYWPDKRTVSVEINVRFAPLSTSKRLEGEEMDWEVGQDGHSDNSGKTTKHSPRVATPAPNTPNQSPSPSPTPEPAQEPPLDDSGRQETPDEPETEGRTRRTRTPSAYI